MRKNIRQSDIIANRVSFIIKARVNRRTGIFDDHHGGVTVVVDVVVAAEPSLFMSSLSSDGPSDRRTGGRYGGGVRRYGGGGSVRYGGGGVRYSGGRYVGGGVRPVTARVGPPVGGRSGTIIIMLLLLSCCCCCCCHARVLK
jgi:uncharacterized membrane protein